NALGVPIAAGVLYPFFGVLLSPMIAAAAIAMPAQAAETGADAAEIAQLRAQIQALSDRLAAQEAAQARADAQIQTIPAQVQTAVAAVPPPAPAPAKPSWTDKTVVSGRMYFDLTNITQESDGSRVQPTGTGFDIKRFYIGVDHKFNDMFSGNVTTDFQYSSAISSTELYIKKAYLQAKFSDALVVRLGSTDLPWVPFAEDMYGYRYVENTLIDRTKFGTSADWGVHASGKLAGGMVSYAVAVVDGAGYKAPLRSKGMDVEGRISITPVEHLTLAVGGYTGKLGKSKQGVTTFHTANRFDAMAAYTTSQFRVGVEYFKAEDWNNVSTVTSDSAEGYSVFGSYQFTPTIGAFARYDRVEPNQDTAPNRQDDYFNVGVTYSPTKIVDLSLVYKRDAVDKGFVSTSNGTIGGLNDGTYDEFGLFGQFRF
ncbi:MAG TPA: porin, partial [Caulobacter sp.]|nr:porin [Caulobacter sp.]